MPDALRTTLIEDSRLWHFVQLLIVASILFLWTLYKPALPDRLLSTMKDPLRHSVEGIAAAAILILSRFAYIMLPNFRTGRLQEHSFAEGPLPIWLLTFVMAGAVEEVWRASCILSIQASEFGRVISVGGTSVAFVLAHMSGIPGRMLGIREELYWELLFGIALGTLFILTESLIAPYIAGLIFNIFNLCLIRYSAK
ncbi:MAG TPA: CPBP family intramembrane glutamic endopeptidase [Candidatus Angelobacter sp.]|nr:CPBP family intramembrane glutamic endopeptidase [Candidatus Angelobacter sp.]